MENSGFFLVIEGPNGAGKSSLCKAIRDLWKNDGGDAVIVSEPSDTQIGELVRAYRELPEHPWTLACLLAADRYSNLVSVIRPSKSKGLLVLSDRYLPSTLVYQRMHGLSLEFLRSLNTGIDVPDLTILLDVDFDVLKARLLARGMESYSENVESLVREADLYRTVASILRELGHEIVIIQPQLDDQVALARRILACVRAKGFGEPSIATSV